MADHHSKELQMSGWRQDAIDQKFAFVRKVKDLSMSIKYIKESIKMIFADRQKGKSELEVSSCHWIILENLKLIIPSAKKTSSYGL